MFRRRSFALAAALAVAAVALAGCGDDSDTSTTGASASATPTVTDAWARTSAAGTTTGAAYMVITGGAAADRLVAAAAPTSVSKTTEIHETVKASGGMSPTTMAGMSPATTMAGHSHSGSSAAMSMRPVSGIDIPAKGKVALEPGGYHVMFIDLAKPLAKGDTFTLSLTFEKAGKIDVPITVRDAA